MWKLELPDNSDAMGNIDLALNYVKGGSKYDASLTEKSEIEKIYLKYEDLKGVNHKDLQGLHLKKEFLAAMENAYTETQKKGRLKDLRARLFLNAKRCPSCGILPVDELDHHLPKSIFKPLAVYSSNLVPYCHVCNKHKLALPGTDDVQRFIHAYYDDVPLKEQFLFANVWIEGISLQCNFEIRKTLSMSDTMVKRLQFQMQRVDLEQRVIRELFDFLTPTAIAIQDNFEVGGTALVKIYLSRTASQLMKSFGVNDWRPVIFNALANCDDFCNGGFYESLSLERPI